MALVASCVGWHFWGLSTALLSVGDDGTMECGCGLNTWLSVSLSATDRNAIGTDDDSILMLPVYESWGW